MEIYYDDEDLEIIDTLNDFNSSIYGFVNFNNIELEMINKDEIFFGDKNQTVIYGDIYYKNNKDFNIGLVLHIRKDELSDTINYIELTYYENDKQYNFNSDDYEFELIINPENLTGEINCSVNADFKFIATIDFIIPEKTAEFFLN